MIILRNKQKEFGWKNAKDGFLAGSIGGSILALPLLTIFPPTVVLAAIAIMTGIFSIGGLFIPDTGVKEKLPQGPTTFKKQVEAIARLKDPEVVKFIKDLDKKYPELNKLVKVLKDPKVKRPDWMEPRDPKIEFVIGAWEPEEDFLPVLWIGGDADDGDYLGINPETGKWVSIWETNKPIDLKKYLIQAFKFDLESIEDEYVPEFADEDDTRRYKESKKYIEALISSIQKNL